MNVCPEWLCGGEKGARSQHKMTPGGGRGGSSGGGGVRKKYRGSEKEKRK